MAKEWQGVQDAQLPETMAMVLNILTAAGAIGAYLQTAETV